MKWKAVYFLSGVFFSILAVGFPSNGQAAVVVAIRSSQLPLYEQALVGFRQCVNDARVFVFTLPEGSVPEKMANDMLAKNPDVILTMGTTATRFARERLKGIPSVFCMVIDPTSNGITGPGVAAEVDAVNQVEFIQRHFPSLQRIGVLYSAGRCVESVANLRELKASGKADMVFAEVPVIQQLEKAIAKLTQNVDCLLMLPDTTIYTPQVAPQIILQTLQSGIPMIAASSGYVKAGALISLHESPDNNGCMAAGLVNKIFAGEKASEIQWPTKMKRAVNLVVADRLKIRVGRAVTEGAEQVIQ